MVRLQLHPMVRFRARMSVCVSMMMPSIVLVFFTYDHVVNALLSGGDGRPTEWWHWGCIGVALLLVMCLWH